jgi:hypothetical protein
MDNLEKLFNDLENNFDIENPKSGHEARFLEKLNTQDNKVVKLNSKRNFWKPFIGIAASITLLFSLFIGNSQSNEPRDLASISPEMEQTQTFFTNAIQEELSKLENETSEEAQAIITDALSRIENLESQYKKLQLDLEESGDDKRVIYAMISNFQNRIDLLQNVLQQIEDVKQLKNLTNGNSSTL